MANARLRPIPGSAALAIAPVGGGPGILLLADLHLGLGGSARWPAGPPEGSPERLAESIRRDAAAAGTRTVVIAGDVKHPIVGTPAPLRPVIFRFFAGLLEGGLRPEVVLGNHDVGLVPHLPREVRVHPASGIVRHGVGIFHGHCWPSDRVLRQPRLVVGHLHPGFRFAPTTAATESKQRCWVRTELDPTTEADRAGRRPKRRFTAREAVVLPAYHPLAGTESLNRSAPSRGRSFLFARLLAHGRSRLYLLDGTDLGALSVPTGGPPRRSRR